MSLFQCTILLPEKTFLEESVTSVYAPGEVGYLEVLANHAPLATSLTQGTIRIKRHYEWEKSFYLWGGFMEVKSNHVIILADKIEEVV